MSNSESFVRFGLALAMMFLIFYMDQRTTYVMAVALAVAAVLITGYHAYSPYWPDLKRTVLDAVGEQEIIDRSARIEPTVSPDEPEGGDYDGEAVEDDAEPTPIRGRKRQQQA